MTLLDFISQHANTHMLIVLGVAVCVAIALIGRQTRKTMDYTLKREQQQHEQRLDWERLKDQRKAILVDHTSDEN